MPGLAWSSLAKLVVVLHDMVVASSHNNNIKKD
jgi:hypothetical protein